LVLGAEKIWGLIGILAMPSGALPVNVEWALACVRFPICSAPGAYTFRDDRDFGDAERSWDNHFEAERNRRKRLFHIDKKHLPGQCGVGPGLRSIPDSFCAAPFDA
jgi:hypothetical protein